MRLSCATLDQLRPGLRRPDYDLAALGCGVVHLGLGAFHRAHQALFTEDAIEASGGDWGIIGVSMRKPDIAASMAQQDGLYTVETLDAEPQYRVCGAIRRQLTLPLQTGAVLDALAAPTTTVVTLTVTEKGYCLAGEALDFSHPQIAHDLAHPETPLSAIGALSAGLAQRRRSHGGPLTIVSCDNVMDNGQRLRAAVLALSERIDPALSSWIEREASFPDSMVDCIVPAPTAESRARVDAAIGLEDEASVQREPFAQWVIEDHFVAPRPDWGAVGVQLTASVAHARRLKLHVLNAAHSALAYLGLARGHVLVRQAVADPQIARFLDAMIRQEVASALPELPVREYWTRTLARFGNPMIDHRLDQIAMDGAEKLDQRIYPLLRANEAHGRDFHHLAQVAQAWSRYSGQSTPSDIAALLNTMPNRSALLPQD